MSAKDSSYQESNPRFMHNVDLGAPMPTAERIRLIYENRESDILRAILQELRDAAAIGHHTTAECTRNRAWVDKASMTGQVTTGPMDEPAFHAGAAQGSEDAFWQFWQWSQGQKEQKEEGAAGDNG